MRVPEKGDSLVEFNASSIIYKPEDLRRYSSYFQDYK